METLLCLSIALFAGLMLSRVAKIFQLPAVTAYLVAGILVGPFCLGAFGVEGLGFTIKDLIDRGERFVHPDTIDAYNEAMMNILKQKQEKQNES